MVKNAKSGTKKKLLGWAKQVCAAMIFTTMVLPGVSQIDPSAFNSQGPLLLEVFAGSATLSSVFVDNDATIMEPLDIKYGNFDILNDADFEKCKQRIRDSRPALISLAFECTDFCSIHNIMMKIPGYAEKLQRKRLKAGLMLMRSRELFDLQISLGGHAIVENPLNSQGWKHKAWQDLVNPAVPIPGINEAVMHQCRTNKRDEVTGLLLKKPNSLDHYKP